MTAWWLYSSRVVVKIHRVGRMQPETSRITSFNDTSSVFVWVLWHQTGVQYSVGVNTSAVAEVF